MKLLLQLVFTLINMYLFKERRIKLKKYFCVIKTIDFFNSLHSSKYPS